MWLFWNWTIWFKLFILNNLYSLQYKQYVKKVWSCFTGHQQTKMTLLKVEVSVLKIGPQNICIYTIKCLFAADTQDGCRPWRWPPIHNNCESNVSWHWSCLVRGLSQNVRRSWQLVPVVLCHYASVCCIISWHPHAKPAVPRLLAVT